jgi:hypothetical protein
VSDVYVHIGLHKTGTTSIQAALTQRADALRATGTLFPGGSHRAHLLAAYDLLGRRIDGDDTAPVVGAWQRLVEEAAAWPGQRVIVSEELLSFARPRQVRALAAGLGRDHLQVVVGVRDLGRTLTSAWQQEITQGRTYRWDEYVAAVQAPGEAGPASAGVAFWLRFDLLRILQTWERVVPRDRVHLVVVPPPGSPPQLLLDRFSAAVGLPPGALTADVGPQRPSLGAVEVEVLRRLNAAVLDDLSQKAYSELVRRALRPGLSRPGSRPLVTPAAEAPWLQDRTAALIAGIRAGEYRVVGDLAELSPVVASPSERAPDDVTDSELLPPTQDALAELSRQFAVLWKRHRRTKPVEPVDAPATQRLLSQARASVFGAKVQAFEAADRNRALAWLARRSVR